MKTAVLVMSLPFLLLSAGASLEPAKMAQPAPLLTLRGHTEAVDRVRYSPDGKRIATASADKTAALWDAATGQRLHLFRGHTGPVSGVAFSPTGDRIATAAYDGTVRIWDAATGQAIVVFDSVHSKVYGLAFSPTGDHLASAGSPSTGESGVNVWDVGGKRRAGFDLRDRSVFGIAYSRDGRRLGTALLAGGVIVWEVASGKKALALPSRGFMSDVTVAWSPGGRRLASAGLEGPVQVWDAASGKIQRMRGQKPLVTEVAFTHDGKWVVVAAVGPASEKSSPGYSGEVRAWDIATGEGCLLQSSEESGIYSLSFGPDGTRLATAHGDGTVRVWPVKQMFGRARPTR